jgi:shikimate kinase
VPAVVAAAAGAVFESGVAVALRAHRVVYLRVRPDVLARRVGEAGDAHRPFGGRAPDAVLREQFRVRDRMYGSLASDVIAPGDLAPGDLAPGALAHQISARVRG